VTAAGKRCAAIFCSIRKYNSGNPAKAAAKAENKKQEKGACSYFYSTFAFGYFLYSYFCSLFANQLLF
jgi:hypothetical protein